MANDDRVSLSRTSTRNLQSDDNAVLWAGDLKPSVLLTPAVRAPAEEVISAFICDTAGTTSAMFLSYMRDQVLPLLAAPPAPNGRWVHLMDKLAAHKTQARPSCRRHGTPRVAL